jgi:tRNA(Ile)-lysidine synthase
LEEELEKRKRVWCRQEGGALFFEIEKMAIDPHLSYWLFALFTSYGFDRSQVGQIIGMLQAQSGRKICSGTHTLYKDRGVLALLPNRWETTLTQVQVAFLDGSTYQLCKKCEIAALDADKLQFPLTLRLWERGDRFMPYGMKGDKKISDFLTDLHIPLWEKERQLVLCSGGVIVWVVGRRIDNRYKIDSATKKVAEISIFE